MNTPSNDFFAQFLFVQFRHGHVEIFDRFKKCAVEVLAVDTSKLTLEAKFKEEQALKQKMERSVKINLRND